MGLGSLYHDFGFFLFRKREYVLTWSVQRHKTKQSNEEVIGILCLLSSGDWGNEPLGLQEGAGACKSLSRKFGAVAVWVMKSAGPVVYRDHTFQVYSTTPTAKPASTIMNNWRLGKAPMGLSMSRNLLSTSLVRIMAATMSWFPNEELSQCLGSLNSFPFSHFSTGPLSFSLGIEASLDSNLGKLLSKEPDFAYSSRWLQMGFQSRVLKASLTLLAPRPEAPQRRCFPAHLPW